MKRFLPSIIVLASFIFLMGMGEMGGSAPAGKTPVPEKNFNVRVTDREGVQTTLSQFSQEGKVFLAGKRGDANVTIPFEKISRVEFQALEGKEMQAKVSLREKEDIDLKLEKPAKFYGRADFGTFQIDAKDVKSISFLP